MSIELIKKILPKRPINSNKGTFGHVLNIAGSKFYTGAAYFSSISALKVGCGKVSLHSDLDVLKSIAALSPDIILQPEFPENLSDFQVISIGCGLSCEKIELFKKAILLTNTYNSKIIIDADGLNILANLKNFNLPENTILTPHPKEMARLMHTNTDEILSNTEFWLKECVKKYNAIVILKLHNTLICDKNGEIFENCTGNSALSHGGTGDVLTGMVSGFLAQEVSPYNACILAVYLHGLAAEIASKELTEYSMLASDLIKFIPNAIKQILQ